MTARSHASSPRIAAMHPMGETMPTIPSPPSITSVDQLEDLLSAPTPEVAQALSRVEGDLIVLGVGGKMGPTLARMARRASDEAGVRRRVIGVSRFSQPGLEERLRQHGVETIRCDLLDQSQLDSLPDAPLVIGMTGMKFGATGQAALTWAMNSYLPGMICQKFRRSRIVAFSTGNVYPLAPVAQGGSLETDPLDPVGDYAMSALGRERIYEHFSRSLEIPMALLRLNYAAELRYGVLVDLAGQIWRQEPIDLGMGHFNTLWQADANAIALRALEYVDTPPWVLNVAGPEILSVRRVCQALAEQLGRQATFRGVESADALLSNAQLCHQRFGYPTVSARQLVEWVAEWVRMGGESLNKPTHFEARDGKF